MFVLSYLAEHIAILDPLFIITLDGCWSSITFIVAAGKHGSRYIQAAKSLYFFKLCFVLFALSISTKQNHAFVIIGLVITILVHPSGCFRVHFPSFAYNDVLPGSWGDSGLDSLPCLVGQSRLIFLCSVMPRNLSYFGVPTYLIFLPNREWLFS